VNNPPKIAQISDCHLYGDNTALHHGANVYQNLVTVLQDIKSESIDAIVFTGDLTQDHSAASYQHFVNAFAQANISVVTYYLAGNHDEPLLLNKYLNLVPFKQDKQITLGNWEINLLDSKSETPAGFVNDEQLNKISQLKQAAKNQSLHRFLMMHHHPIDVGYFIDRHGLENQDDFWCAVESNKQIKAIACGHIHQALTIKPTNSGRSVNLYTCPATSIQFDPKKETVASNGQSAGYRIFTLHENGRVESEVKFLSDKAHTNANTQCSMFGQGELNEN
jgi:Icc protein